MSEYLPEVGHRVRLDNWVPDSYVTVTHVGRDYLLAVNCNGEERPYELVASYKGRLRIWSRYEPPRRTTTVRIHTDQAHTFYISDGLVNIEAWHATNCTDDDCDRVHVAITYDDQNASRS